MKRSLILLGAALLAFAGSFGLRAHVAYPVKVSDAAILAGMPQALSEFGFFEPGEGLEPSHGVFGYELNTPLWSDGAGKLRHIYLPEGAQIKTDGDGLLQFPVGSAIIKTFAFGEGADRRLIETRLLLHRADGWTALPYRWNAEQTEATLALAGARLPITGADGEEFSYRIPNKNQCKSCHSLNDVVMPIGPKARNLDPELLQRLAARGALDRDLQVARPMPKWRPTSAHVSPDDTAAQARAYLDVNCAHCHQPGGGASNSGLDLRWEQNDPFAFGVNKPPVAAGRGAGDLLVSIKPGDPDASILVHRMNSNDPGVAMPELGRSTVDHDAVAMMRAWIADIAE